MFLKPSVIIRTVQSKSNAMFLGDFRVPHSTTAAQNIVCEMRVSVLVLLIWMFVNCYQVLDVNVIDSMKEDCASDKLLVVFVRCLTFLSP